MRVDPRPQSAARDVRRLLAAEVRGALAERRGQCDPLSQARADENEQARSRSHRDAVTSAALERSLELRDIELHLFQHLLGHTLGLGLVRIRDHVAKATVVFL